MFIFADASKISELVFALKDQRVKKEGPLHGDAKIYR